MLPSEVGLVQLASGMLLSRDGKQLLLAFGEQDCVRGARREGGALAATLDDVLAGAA